MDPILAFVIGIGVGVIVSTIVVHYAERPMVSRVPDLPSATEAARHGVQGYYPEDFEDADRFLRLFLEAEEADLLDLTESPYIDEVEPAVTYAEETGDLLEARYESTRERIAQRITERMLATSDTDATIDEALEALDARRPT